MRIEIDRKAGQPLYDQVAASIREAVLSRQIAGGARLPATRTLAQDLGIHRHTVAAAYRRLEAEGLLRTAVGAGTFVVEALPATEGERGFSWEELLRHRAGPEPDPLAYLRTGRVPVPSDPIRLNGAVPDSREFPMDGFITCMREVLDGADPHLLEYGPPEGYEPLRAWIAEWLADWGVEGVEAERVFIISGSQQGIDLLARLFLTPGDRVLLEAPTYTGAFMVLREAGARMVTIPIAAQGLRMDELRRVLGREPIKLIYVMPCYQNPTGTSMDPLTRQELLALAHGRGLPIIEDHYTSPLHYWGPPPRSLLSEDPEGRVIHLGTFSKFLFPGLRLGWMVVPRPLCQPLRRLRWATDLSSGTFTQQLLERFCRSGRLTDHLDRLRKINGRRLKVMLHALEKHFPAEARWTRPEGGMTLWVELPEMIDAAELLREAASQGVLFAPGPAFYPNGGGRSGLRLSFNREDEKRIRRGVRLLGSLVKERMRHRRPTDRTGGDAVPFL